MRLALIIILLAVIALGLVHIRRMESTARCEIHRLRLQQTMLRRRVWDQQVRLGYLTAPTEIRRRADVMALGLIESNRQVDRLVGIDRSNGQ